jgi:transposase
MNDNEIDAIIRQFRATVGKIEPDLIPNWTLWLRGHEFQLVFEAVGKVANDYETGILSAHKGTPNLQTVTSYTRRLTEVKARQESPPSERGHQECQHCGNRGKLGIVLASEHEDFRPCRQIQAGENDHLARFYVRQDWPCPHCAKGRFFARARGIDQARLVAVGARAFPIMQAIAYAEELQHYADLQHLGIPLPRNLTEPPLPASHFTGMAEQVRTVAAAAAVLAQPVGRFRQESVASPEDDWIGAVVPA